MKVAKLARKPSKEGKLKCWLLEEKIELKENLPWEKIAIVEHYKMKLSIIPNIL